MIKQKPKQLLRFAYLLRVGLIALVVSVPMVFWGAQRAQGAASTNLNFQARLLGGSGAIVADGTYNIEFKLYNVSSGGSALWTETRITTNKVTVKSGYLSVYLGSVTSLPTSINWNEEHWLTMNVGGTGTPGWDGEMNPRIKLTAVPFAFQAEQLAKTSGANRGTLGFNTVANNPAITLPDATGTVCLQTASACGFATGSGTAWLQSGNNFGGTTGGVLGTTNNGSLDLITNNTTRLSISSAGAVQIQSGSLSVGTTAQQGLLAIHDGNGQTATISVGSGLVSNTALAIPTGVSTSDTFCLETLANCTGGAGGAPNSAEYLTLSSNGTLSAERVLTSGSNIAFTDGGANGNLTVATVQNPTFTTSVTTPLLTSSGALTITPGGAMIVGATGQTALLRGSTLSLTSTGATNDITLTSADQIILDSTGTIELQDGTNVTGALGVTGLATIGTLGTASNNTVVCRNGSNQLATCTSTFATTTTAFLQNGNSFSAAAVLGTNDANDLILRSNSNERIKVLANGDIRFNQTSNTLYVDAQNDRVGIGTATPQRRLEVKDAAARIRIDSPNASDSVGIELYNQGSSFRGGFIYNSATGNTDFYGPNGTEAISINSSRQIILPVLGSASNDTAICRNGSNQLATCSSTFATTANAFMQSGNGFGATGVLGTTDNNGLQVITNGVGRAFFNTSGVLYMGNAGSAGTAAAPNNATMAGTQSATAGTAGGNLAVTGGSGATTGAGSAGGTITLQGGSGGSTNMAGGNTIVAGGRGTGTAAGGSILFQIATPGSSGSSNNALATVGTISGTSGTILLQPSADTTTAFNIKTSLGNNGLTFDSSNGRLGVGLGSNNVPAATLESKGSLRISGLAAGGGNVDHFTTPVGSSVETAINIPIYDPGGAGQVIAMGIPSTSATNSRVISIFDARTVAHQPSMGVFSPNENNILGFSWDGSNTVGYLKTTGGNIGIKSNATDIATFAPTAISLLQNTTISGTLDVQGGSITNTTGAMAVSGNTTLTLQSTGANAVTLDSTTTGTVNVGTSNNGKTIQIGSTTLSSGTQAIGIGNNNTSGGTTNITIGTGTSATGGTTTVQAKGALTLTGTGGITATGAAASSLSTSAGGLTLTGAAASTWSTTTGLLTVAGGSGLTLQATGNNAMTLQTNGVTRIATTGTGATTVTGGTSGDALTVSNSTSTGNILVLQDNATPVFTVADGGNIISTGQFQSGNGTAGAPTYSFSGDPDTGMYSGGTNVLSFATAGVERFEIGATGDVVAQVGTDSATAFQLQNSVGATLFSLDSTQSGNLGINGGAETSGTFATNWTAHGGAASPSRTTTGSLYASGTAGVAQATTATTHGVRNNLGAALATQTTYNVSFSVKTGTASITNTNLIVEYYRTATGPALDATCSTFDDFTTIGTSTFIKYTCTFTTSATGGAATAFLAIRQGDGTARTLYIDNLSIVARNATGTQNTGVLRVGGSTSQGLTLLTLDTYAGQPFSSTNATLAGSMYFDTTTNKIQCYDGTSWGACGAAPNGIVTLTPEYAGATLNGTGIGTLSSDFCSNSAGVLSIGTLCASGEARNFYKWTSPQGTLQTYSIYVTYKLPSTFRSFVDANTMKLTWLTDSASGTNGKATYQVYRKASAGGVTSCDGSNESTVTTPTASVWNTTNFGGDETACGFVGGDYVIFKINVKSMNNANIYVENLDFAYTNQ